MVTKKSMKTARKKLKRWKHENPGAPIAEKAKRMGKAYKDGFEMEVGLHTLPSIFAPMPEESVRDLKKRIDAFKNR